MLVANGLCYAAGGTAILRDVSLAVSPGELCGIVGPNGAGKSTLLRILAGLLPADAGTVLYDGKPLADYQVEGLARTRSFLSQRNELSFPMSVASVVMMGRYPHFSTAPGAADREACDEVMRYFDVLRFRDREFGTLSGGEQQRVHFARAAAQVWNAVPGRSRLLLLDEPLTYLDIGYQRQFMDQLKQLTRARELTVLAVVHDLSLAARYADRLLLLHNGGATGPGGAKEILAAQRVREVFGVESNFVTVNGQERLVY